MLIAESVTILHHSAYLSHERLRRVTIMAIMTPGRWINFVAVVLGALGAFVLYWWSFTFESTFGYGMDGNALNARNRRRQRMQRVGLVLIFVSFALQGIALFFD